MNQTAFHPRDRPNSLPLQAVHAQGAPKDGILSLRDQRAQQTIAGGTYGIRLVESIPFVGLPDLKIRPDTPFRNRPFHRFTPKKRKRPPHSLCAEVLKCVWLLD